jgi:hypothetical protein
MKYNEVTWKVDVGIEGEWFLRFNHIISPFIHMLPLNFYFFFFAELPIGLGQQKLFEEYQITKILKDKEVAKLDYDYAIEMGDAYAGRATQRAGMRSNVPLMGGGHSKKIVGVFGGLTKCERFAQAIQRGGRGKKGRRKKKEKMTYDGETHGTNDTISLDSTEEAGAGGCQKPVQVSAIQIVLVEGESNDVRDIDNRAYRLEAERLFNIGLNMGATSNVERITMVERLMDMEANDVAREVDLGDDEVD